jgi:hypothetical protein
LFGTALTSRFTLNLTPAARGSQRDKRQFPDKTVANSREKFAAGQHRECVFNHFGLEGFLRYDRAEIMSTNPTKKLFNVYEFRKMEDAGILSCTEHVELIYGEILVKAVPNPPHNASLPGSTGQ